MSNEEPHVAAALAELCKQLDVRCVVQVGAETGYEADTIRAQIGCRAVCIEADERCKSTSDSLEYHYAVIGAQDQIVNFYLHPTSGLSSTLSRGEGGECQFLRQWRLDTFCAAHSIEPDALIIDTEGTTLDVLEGCGALLNGLKLIYAECQTCVIRPGVRTLDEVERFLSTRGFVRRLGPPAYDGGSQGNYTWIKTKEVQACTT